MNPIDNKLIKDKIEQKLSNDEFSIFSREANEVLFSNKQLAFEQYKLLVDSSHKIEERRSGTNSIFLGINTLLASFLIRPSQLTDLKIMDVPFLIVLVFIGMFISWDWIKVTEAYKRLNFINYCMIQSFEKRLPTNVFSLRGEIEERLEEEPKPSGSKANIILIRENLLIKLFLLFYLLYLITMSVYTLGRI